ncbi:MAG: response regulator transcription factor [Magnetospirillum sp.]|nr:response regulator transcription factor [Magnetospirillum sp.]
MRVVIADDHALFRGGLRFQLAEVAAGADIVEASSFDELMRLVEAGPPAELVIVDLSMPGPPWDECLRAVRCRWPAARMVVLTADGGAETMQRALKAGAHGFVPKSEQPHVFVAALKLVLSGGNYYPVSALGLTVPAGEAPASRVAMEREPVEAHLPAITGRQRDVLHLLAEGCANKEIAYRLGLTEGTVKLHVAALLRCLGAHNRTHAVSLARNGGLIPK